MPLVCTILLTLAALGIVFVLVLIVCAVDVFRTWRRWRRFVRLVETLDARLSALIPMHNDARSNGDNAMGNDIACIDERPLIPCRRNDCPRRSRSGQP